jgi:glucose/arabinose dehydrogenase
VIQTRLLLILFLLSPTLAFAGVWKGKINGPDKARTVVDAGLERVKAGKKAVGGQTLTEVRFVERPGGGYLLVLGEKRGKIRWLDLETGAEGALLELDQIGPTGKYIEEGLLGFAFHPKFAETGLLYTSHTDPRHSPTRSVITEWQIAWAGAVPSASSPREVLGILQPDKGHHGGQIQFGPDGYLYIALGDGGSQRDPDEMGQDTTTFMSTMMRIDVDGRMPGRGYAVPPDNPFVDGKKHLKEVWAYGLRNPWRFSFAPDGRLIVADVGQGSWEEINIIEKGGNYGWSVKEATDCFAPDRVRRIAADCQDESFADPLYAYGRDDGGAVIGGYVYTGSALPQIKDHYVFADNTNGRIWALRFPKEDSMEDPEVLALGRFDWWITTFGQGPDGELYVGGWDGRLFKLVPQD